ncbi:Mediator of RNA polymerase II transcription subunit 6 [Chlorella vulgaris]
MASGQVPSHIVTEDLTGTCWRDDLWLGAFGLHHGNVLDYFSLSPFYDRACANERGFLAGKPRAQPPALGEGVEYLLADSQPPHLFILRKMYRAVGGTITTLAFYYILDGSIYQAPSLQAALLARMVRMPEGGWHVLGWLAVGLLQRCMFNLKAAFRDMQRDLAPLSLGAQQGPTALSRPLCLCAAASQQQEQSALERELAAGRDVPRATTAADREQQQRVEANIRHVLRKFPLPMPAALLEPGAAAGGGGGAQQVKAERDPSPGPGPAAAAPSATATAGGGAMMSAAGG